MPTDTRNDVLVFADLGTESCELSKLGICFEIPDVSASIMVERSPSA